MAALPGWTEQAARLQDLAALQLFFVGGAPRSGTTWLQRLLNSHPEISCGGEGLFMKHLAEPLEQAMAERRKALEEKNQTVFREAGGFVLPESDATEHLIATGILLALAQQRGDKACRAVGEKTPENVFFFPRLKRMFPAAKFIGIAREPRDVLSSSWHFFHPPAKGSEAREAKLAFIRRALPSLNAGARAMLTNAAQYGSDCIIVTYEDMVRATAPVAARLFRFLGVDDGDAVVARCVAANSFAALSGRAPGVTQDGSFFRGGVVGDWKRSFTPEMNDVILAELGWMYSRFGWDTLPQPD